MDGRITISYQSEPVYLKPLPNYLTQIEANKFCLGDPSDAIAFLSFGDEYLTLKEKILKRFFPNKYSGYMAKICERSCGRRVIRMSKI